MLLRRVVMLFLPLGHVRRALAVAVFANRVIRFGRARRRVQRRAPHAGQPRVASQPKYSPRTMSKWQ